MDIKEELLRKAVELIESMPDYLIEGVTINGYEHNDGLKRLTIDIDYNDSKRRIRTKEGDTWV